MPIYEYACASCRHEFEQLIMSARDQRGLQCPACQGRSVTRKLSVFAAHPAQPVRKGGSMSQGESMGSGCGRCGDPNGPCSM